MKCNNFIALVNYKDKTIYPIILTSNNEISMFDLDCGKCITKSIDWKIHDGYVPVDKTIQSFLNKFKFPYNFESDNEIQGYLSQSECCTISKKLGKKITEIVEMYDWCTGFTFDDVVLITQNPNEV